MKSGVSKGGTGSTTHLTCEGHRRLSKPADRDSTSVADAVGSETGGLDGGK